MTRRFPWRLAVFPAAEVAGFAGACLLWSEHPVLAVGLLLAAALALNFAVHVFFHECIHYSASRPLPPAFAWAATLCMGAPFDGYRVHHLNHHRHDNGPGDFSSTLRFGPDGRPAPRPLWSYVLGWPSQSLAVGRFLRSGAAPPALARMAPRILSQQNLVLVFVALLALWSWPAAVLYLLMIYLGWALIALQNYGQHAPAHGGAATTYTNPVYNRLLFNNGLHGEHHAAPDRPWYDLAPGRHGTRIDVPHLAHPIISTEEARHG